MPLYNQRPRNYRPPTAQPGQIGIGLAPWLRQGGQSAPFRFAYNAELGGAAPRPDDQPMPLTPPTQGLPSYTPQAPSSGGAMGTGYDWQRLQKTLAEQLRGIYGGTQSDEAPAPPAPPPAAPTPPPTAPTPPPSAPAMPPSSQLGPPPAFAPTAPPSAPSAPPPAAPPSSAPPPAAPPTSGPWYDEKLKAQQAADAAAMAERKRQEELARQAALAEQLRLQQLREQQEMQQGRRANEAGRIWQNLPNEDASGNIIVPGVPKGYRTE